MLMITRQYFTYEEKQKIDEKISTQE